MTTFRVLLGCVLLSLGATFGFSAAGKTVTVTGYVLDSACAFTKAGSPLVILAGDGTIYWPIADTTPSSGQNGKLMSFAGQTVKATGRVFQRGGSSALVVETIEAAKDGK
jgi:type 1 fimbria pilin